MVTGAGLPGGMNGQFADALPGHGHPDRDMHVLTKPFAMEVSAARIKALIDGQG